MKTKKILLATYLVLLCTALPPTIQCMPGADDAEGTEGAGEEQPAAAQGIAPQGAAPQKEGVGATVAAEKTTPLAWPDTTQVSEDNKKLLQSNSKEIVQLFTQAQEVCKNMDDTLDALNTQRDAANKQYRDTINDLDPLLQRIGAAQAAHKK